MGILVIFGGIIAFGIYSSSRFRLVSVEPKQKASTVAPVVFTFNRVIDPKTAAEFEIQPYTAGRTSVQDKKVIFEPASKYRLGQTYTATLKSVWSSDGSRLGVQKVTFQIAFVPLEKLSESDRAAQEASTDTLEQKNPLLAKLPYETLQYKVDYELSQQAGGKTEVTITVTLYAILNRPEQRPAYEAQLREYKQKALQWIQEQGVDISTYKVVFNPPV